MTTTNNTTSIEDIDAGYLAQFCANDLLTIVQRCKPAFEPKVNL